MKSVLISIKPKWCELIANGKKVVEVRRTRPKIETPFKCYIYCTKTNYPPIALLKNKNNNVYFGDYRSAGYGVYVEDGKVIGEFVCDMIYKLPCGVNQPFWLKEKTCIDDEHYKNYLGNKDGYGWHISDLKIYDKPKELGEFKKYYECGNNSCGNCNKCDKDYHLTKPPQSWCYVEVEE